MSKIVRSKFLPGSLKGLLFSGFLCLSAGLANAQSPQSYIYRTKAPGNWNTLGTWERAHKNTPTAFGPLNVAGDIPNRTAEQVYINHAVQYDYPNNIDEVYISADGALEIPNGRQVNIFNIGTNDGIVVQGSNIGGVVKSGVLRNLGGTFAFFKDGSGTPATAGSNVKFNANSKYEHNVAGAIGYVPLATWDDNSNIEFNMNGNLAGLATLGDFIARGYNQSFGNVKWNTATNAQNLDLKGALSNIKGNFEVIATGTGNSGSSTSALVLSSNGNHSLTIGKSLLVSGTKSDVVFSTSGAAAGGSLELAIGEGMRVFNGGAFRNNTGGTPLKVYLNGVGVLQGALTNFLYHVNYEIASNAVITLANDLTIPGPLTTGNVLSNIVVKGVLKPETFNVKGNGNFALDNGGTLFISSAAGINQAGSLGHIQVAGARSYSSLANYYYNGTTAQNSGTGIPASVAGLTINNAAGLTLSKSVTVDGTLSLLEGPVKTSLANKLVLNSGVTVVKSEYTQSYVEGPLSRVLNSDFDELVFPVGQNGKNRTVTLTVGHKNPVVPTLYTVQQVEGAPATTRTFPATVDKISSIRHFQIHKGPFNGTESEVSEAFVKIAYDFDDVVTDYTNLTIVKSGNGTDAGKWLDLGGGASGNGAGEVQSSIPFTTFSDFVIANMKFGANPLPVEMVSFDAKKAGKSVVLNWATASEKLNAHFIIERSSNATDFETVAKVAGNATTSAKQKYQFTDTNPLQGLSYYRLKQVDLDNKYAYSSVVSVNLNQEIASPVVYPNPAASVLNLDLKQNASGTVVRILNIFGQEVLKNTLNESLNQQLNIENLPVGAYQIIFENGNTKSMTRFVKAAR